MHISHVKRFDKNLFSKGLLDYQIEEQKFENFKYKNIFCFKNLKEVLKLKTLPFVQFKEEIETKLEKREEITEERKIADLE